MPAPLNANELRLSMPALPATVNTIKMWQHLPVARVPCRGKASFALTLVTEAIRCEVVSTHIQASTNHSQHTVITNETQPLSLLFFCSWDRIWALMLIFTTNNRAMCVSNSELRHCKTLLSYHWTHQTYLDISYHCAEEACL